MFRKVECPECHKVIEIGPNSQAWCSQWPDGTQHKTKEME